MTAVISRKSIKEILSGECARKSFDIKAHLKAAVNIDRKYLFTLMEYKERIVPVKFSVKEFKDRKADILY